MSVAPTVTRQTGGDGLILSLAGDWTVANSAALEERAASLAEPARQEAGAILDLSAVNRMDTAGAWAIDRARAELADAGIKADYRGARPEYALLLKEAGYQPIEPPKPTHTPTAISLLSAVGELVYTAGYDLAEGVSFLEGVGERAAIRVGYVGPRLVGQGRRPDIHRDFAQAPQQAADGRGHHRGYGASGRQRGAEGLARDDAVNLERGIN